MILKIQFLHLELKPPPHLLHVLCTNHISEVKDSKGLSSCCRIFPFLDGGNPTRSPIPGATLAFGIPDSFPAGGVSCVQWGISVLSTTKPAGSTMEGAALRLASSQCVSLGASSLVAAPTAPLSISRPSSNIKYRCWMPLPLSRCRVCML